MHEGRNCPQHHRDRLSFQSYSSHMQFCISSVSSSCPHRQFNPSMLILTHKVRRAPGKMKIFVARNRFVSEQPRLNNLDCPQKRNQKRRFKLAFLLNLGILYFIVISHKLCLKDVSVLDHSFLNQRLDTLNQSKCLLRDFLKIWR